LTVSLRITYDEYMRNLVTILVLAASCLVLFPQQSLAQTVSPSPILSPTVTTPTNPRRQELQQQLRETRTKAREEYKTQMQQLREQFKERLATITDKRKKQIIERIDGKISTVNERSTNRMETIITKLTALLNRVKEKAATAKQNGNDTATLDTAILNGENALASAAAAVSAQQEKEYVIQFKDEATAKSSVGAVLKQLHADLQAVNQTVLAARQAVQEAVRELKQLSTEKRRNPTGTVTVSPTMSVMPSVTEIPTITP
jgi:hypothetical protein